MYGIGKLIEDTNALLKDIKKYLIKVVYGVETTTRVKRFSNNQELNLKDLGGGKGVIGFSLRNIGNTIIYISTSAIDEREPIYPEQVFAINGDTRVCDKEIRIEFGKEYADYQGPFSGKNAIVRYLKQDC